jgi:WD40 repeat protein
MNRMIAACALFAVSVLPMLAADEPAKLPEPKEFTAHTKGVVGVAFTGDGKVVVSGSTDKTVRRYDLATGGTKKIWEESEPVTGLAAIPGGNEVAVRFGRFLYVLDPNKDRAKVTVGCSYTSRGQVVASADGKWLAAPGSPGELQLFDAATLKAHGANLEPRSSFDALAVGPDDRLYVPAWPRHIYVWDVAKRKRLRTLYPNDDGDWSVGPVRAIAVRSDGKVVAALAGSTLWLWDGDGDLPVAGIKPPPSSSFGAVAFVPDSNLLVTTAGDGLTVWDAGTQKPVAVSKEGAYATSLAVSADGKQVAAGFTDGKVRVWDISKLRAPVAKIQGRPGRNRVPDEPEVQVAFVARVLPTGQLHVTRVEEHPYRLHPGPGSTIALPTGIPITEGGKAVEPGQLRLRDEVELLFMAEDRQFVGARVTKRAPDKLVRRAEEFQKLQQDLGGPFRPNPGGMLPPATQKKLEAATEAIAKLVAEEPTDNLSFEMLVWVLGFDEPKTSEKAADLLITHHAKTPQFATFVRVFGRAGPGGPLDMVITRLPEHQDAPPTLRAYACDRIARWHYERAIIAGDKDATAAAEKYLRRLKEEFPKLRGVLSYERPYGPTYADLADELLWQIENTWVGKKAPELAGTDPDGNKVSLADLRGKVVLVRFLDREKQGNVFVVERHWLTMYKDKPFVCVTVFVDRDKNTLKTRLAQDKVTWPVVWDGPDEQGPNATKWRPRLHDGYLIGADGVIQSRGLNPVTLKPVIDTALKDAAEKK